MMDPTIGPATLTFGLVGIPVGFVVLPVGFAALFEVRDIVSLLGTSKIFLDLY